MDGGTQVGAARRTRTSVDGRRSHAGRAACATHPWRVVGAWVGILVALIVLVRASAAASRTSSRSLDPTPRRQIDLIESEFAAEQGAVLNLVFAAPEGETLDTPERRAAIEDAIAQARRRRSSRPPRTRRASRASATRSARTRSQTTGASRTRRLSSTRRSRRRIATRSSPLRTPFARRSSRPASPPSSTATQSSRPSSREPRSCSACSPR